MTKKKEPKTYSVKMNYKVGVSQGSMSWNSEAPLSPEVLAELIERVKSELGTSKEIFISSIFVSEGELGYLEEVLERTK